MLKNILRKQLRRITKRFKKQRFFIVISLLIFIAGTLAYTTYMQNRRLEVDPASYSPVLTLIAKAESNNNYNAYFGNATNSEVQFTNMTISEVMAWQAQYVQQGAASSAVGRYQIIDSTLAGLVRQLAIPVSQKFDQAMQDKLAVALLERRGSEKYVNKELTPHEFAANLAKEWAALPKVIGDKPDESFYASDRLNKSRVSVAEIIQAIEPIKPKVF